jgi:hypothetical protein
MIIYYFENLRFEIKGNNFDLLIFITLNYENEENRVEILPKTFKLNLYIFLFHK